MQRILDIIETLPIWVKSSSLFTLLPIYILRVPISDVIRKIKPRWFFKRRFNPITKKDLLAHDFFVSLKEVESKVRKTNFASESGEINQFKRDMMVKLIRRKIKTINDFFSDFIKAPSFELHNTCHFKFEMMTGITWLVEEYNDEAIKEFINLGVSSVDAKYFVHRYEEYRSDIVNSFLDRIESISTSEQYVGNFDRMQTVLEVLTVAIEVIPRDVKSLYVLINGRYDKYNK